MEGKHNQAEQHSTEPLDADETTISLAWQEQVAQASSSAKLAAALRQAPPTLYRRFATAYRDLLALSRARRRKLLRSMGMTLAGAALAFALALGQVPVARAASITVNGSCTLVDAITAANTDTVVGGCAAGSGADTISLSGNVTLTSALPQLNSVITIAGNGFTIARDAGAPDFTVVSVASSGNLTLNNTTISGGRNVNLFVGVGGIFNNGTLTLNNSTVSGNTGYPNAAFFGTGGISNYEGTLTLNNSTVSGNTGGDAGGIMNVSGTATLNNSTISGNTAVSYQYGGIYNFGGTVTLSNTIIANPVSGSNCSSFTPFTSAGYNLSSDGSCGLSAMGDINNGTANLGPLQVNAPGNTATHALLTGSQAIDAGNCSGGAITTDQRGVARPQGSACDIGAFELEQAAGADLSVAVSDTPDPAAVGGSLTYVVTVTNNGPTSATSVSAATTLSGASATILSASSSQGSCTVSAPTVTCSLGTLANGASATITITVEPNATGTVTASSTVSASEADPSSSNNSASQSTTINNTLGCTITGTPGNDTLNGTNGADVICGLGGNDTISGGNGSDTIYAGSGNDIIQGGNSDDTIYAGPGDDTSHGETLLGLLDNGSDTIYGGPGNDTLDGGNGNDTLTDTDGADSLSGSNGNDAIVTQDGVGGDTANGGLGSDSCTVDGSDSTSGC